MKKTLKKKIDFLIRKPLPIIRRTIFFQSFGGQYNDNPKYISEKLHELEPAIEIVWAVSDKSKCNDLPEYVKRVEIDSSEYVKYSCRSQVIVENMNGIRGFISVKPLPFLISLITSKRQLNISTWHGTPLKHIGLDIPDMKQYKYMYTSANYISAGCEYTMEKFQKAFYPAKIKMNGSPRNDILVNFSEEKRENLKKRLGIPLNKKVLLFAPTFRESVYESGIHQIKKLDFNKLSEALVKKFGGDWCFVFRAHHEVMKEINIYELYDKFGNQSFIDGNQHDDMAEYLVVSDVLLTDYSSCMFDYMLTKRPVFLLTLDKFHYCNDERGLYFPMNELPFPCAIDVDALYQNIVEYDVKTFPDKIELFLNKIGNREDGKASERIAMEILDFMTK